MIYVVTAIHVIVCLFLVIVVLLQSGKAADLAGAFGGMGSQTAFGPRGSATVLSKATTIAAAVFMFTSLTLAVLATRDAGRGTSILETHGGKATPSQSAPMPVPVTPGAPGQPAPGKPSVTLTPEGGGAPKTIPLEIPQAPAQGQPQGGKPAAPPKK
jgi:preprotein translocase subunit SecG